MLAQIKIKLMVKVCAFSIYIESIILFKEKLYFCEVFVCVGTGSKIVRSREGGLSLLSEPLLYLILKAPAIYVAKQFVVSDC